MIEKIKKDFKDFKDEAFGILLFGSYVKNEHTKRSDIDICLIGIDKSDIDICLIGIDKDDYLKILKKLGDKYDIKIFEELPLYIKIDIIKNHKVIWGNELEISEYFYKFRKIWRDMEKRIKENQFKSVREKSSLRRRFNGKKKEILGEI
ncbi:nucleotidyltransferase domain-containing protein [Methanothermococcus sp.]|uniref:nucleotidyltransferase domain-containing protein n=1 Tax=Methanothermococcus sp. TaxID=2614238 RepID=UPI0025CF51F2|nr:nucleotidyltransferase domain-containing protein [Methanothermococcus sp.]